MIIYLNSDPEHTPMKSSSSLLLALFSASLVQAAAPHWEWAGWGGGGYFYSSVFHPTKDGVLYMGGDVCGVYKSEDHGQNWRLINDGLADYGVFSLAVDRTAPETVYAATAGGLCKSTDGGAHWRLLPGTDKKGLRITGEKGKSIRCIAVDPARGNIVYAASPGGKVYKSADGGETWKVSYEKASEPEPPETLRIQFGKALITFPRVADKIVMMAVETMIARQITYFAARAKDEGRRTDLEAGMAKLLGARVAWAAADNALQIHGGNGFALEYPVSRLLCDARILNIFEGAAEIQAQVIARRVLDGGN